MSAGGVTYLAAFGGGLISFLSPCVLPIVPGYLSLVTGLDVTEIEEGASHHLGRIARDTGLFIAGFTLVFLLLQLSATAVSRVMLRNHIVLTRVSGLILLAMGLFLIGSLVLKSPWLYQEKRFHPNLSRFGPLAAPVAGIAFGFGWTPCIGPILSSVLVVAANEDQVFRGALLLLAYSAGLGLPFLLTGLAFGRLTGAFGWVKRHTVALTILSATSLCFFGVLLTFNRLTWVTSRLQETAQALGLGWLVRLG
ncbi:MAG TPA: cytochrome c biogenesis protein CcdA [Acidimicrobiales bacterium]|nr:cytochrome c biogenesis protein CcdA [Acidimicrobiales bacterium]